MLPWGKRTTAPKLPSERGVCNYDGGPGRSQACHRICHPLLWPGNHFAPEESEATHTARACVLCGLYWELLGWDMVTKTKHCRTAGLGTATPHLPLDPTAHLPVTKLSGPWIHGWSSRACKNHRPWGWAVSASPEEPRLCLFLLHPPNPLHAF